MDPIEAAKRAAVAKAEAAEGASAEARARERQEAETRIASYLPVLRAMTKHVSAPPIDIVACVKKPEHSRHERRLADAFAAVQVVASVNGSTLVEYGSCRAWVFAWVPHPRSEKPRTVGVAVSSDCSAVFSGYMALAVRRSWRRTMSATMLEWSVDTRSERATGLQASPDAEEFAGIVAEGRLLFSF
jgi:hypothetical protein